MARFLTPPVTVVQGDEAPDIVVTLQQDSSETPYVLTNRVPFAVIVDTADPRNYVHKFQAQVDNANSGKVRISWVKDPVERTSYLDDLVPGKRYEIQIFLGRTDLPPAYIDVISDYEYIAGRYVFTGQYSQGSPVYKHETEDLYLSRSPYDEYARPDEFVWLITSLRAATWDEVRNQDKASMDPSELGETPVWNYRQEQSAEEAAEYFVTPKLGVLSADPDGVLTPDGLQPLELLPATYDAGSPEVHGRYKFDKCYPGNPPECYWDNIDDEPPPERTNVRIADPFEGFYYEIYYNETDVGTFSLYGTYDRPGPGEDFPYSGWNVLNGDAPAPTFSKVPVDSAEVVEIEDSGNIEDRGTQTVLTHIPLKVKTAYRLADED